MRETTLIEHSKAEGKKSEEIRRISCEFEKIQYMLDQRKAYMISQLEVLFSNIEKNLISDLAAAEGQVEYLEHLYSRLSQFYDQHFMSGATRRVRTLRRSSKGVGSWRELRRDKKPLEIGAGSRPRVESGDLGPSRRLPTEREEDKQESEKDKSGMMFASASLPVAIDITSLNTEVSETLPKMEKELNDLKKSFCTFCYHGNKYPQFDLDRTSSHSLQHD